VAVPGHFQAHGAKCVRLFSSRVTSCERENISLRSDAKSVFGNIVGMRLRLRSPAWEKK